MRCTYCDRPGDLCNRVAFRAELEREVCDRCFDELLAEVDLERERREDHGLTLSREEEIDDLSAAQAWEDQRNR